MGSFQVGCSDLESPAPDGKGIGYDRVTNRTFVVDVRNVSQTSLFLFDAYGFFIFGGCTTQ